MITINNLWASKKENDWRAALENYWSFVQPKNIELEKELCHLKLEEVSRLDEIGWYDFLHDKYFRWKYTASIWYATTTRELKRYKNSNRLDSLFDIKKRLLTFDTSNISIGLSIAKEIHGLGIPGASGLLSLMYPNDFGTVDQFVLKALWQIPGLPESRDVKNMKPLSLTRRDGIVLINIMKKKAKENNNVFGTDFWTPRKIDMILWASRQPNYVLHSETKTK